MLFDRTIVETMLPAWPFLETGVRQATLANVADDVTRSITQSPLHVRLGVGMLSIGLGVALKLLAIGAGGPLVRAERAARLYRLIQRLPGPAGAVVRLYRSMALLSFYEQPIVAEGLGTGGEAGR